MMMAARSIRLPVTIIIFLKKLGLVQYSPLRHQLMVFPSKAERKTIAVKLGDFAISLLSWENKHAQKKMLSHSQHKLAKELRSVFGYLELNLNHISIDLPYIDQPSVEFHISVFDNEFAVNRSTDSVSPDNINDFYSTESLEFRCCIGWQLAITATVTDGLTGSKVNVHGDNITIGNSTTTAIPLRLGVKCIGRVEVETAYFPNHQSFKCLVIDCNLNESLPSSLVKEILAILSHERDHFDEYVASDADKQDLLVITRKLQHYASNAEALSIELHNALGNTRYSAETSSIFGPKLPMYKAAKLAKTFLSNLVNNLALAPAVNINLVEKFITIYSEIIFRRSAASLGNSSSSSSGGGGVAGSTMCIGGPGHGHLQHETSIEMEQVFPWPHFLNFCIVSSLWIVQQVLQASSTVQEMPISAKELDALRYDFSQYDPELCGEIPASDLGGLLLDMGMDYTEEEVNLILAEINPDSLQTVEFSEFVRWWCKEEEEEEDGV